MSAIKLTTRLLGLADGKEEWGENRTEINILREAAARIAELEAEVDAEKRWRKVCLDGSAKRLAELEALFRLDGEQHAAAVNAARHEQDKRVEVYADRITKLEVELKMARLVFGKAVIRHTNKDPDDLWDALMWEIKDARPAS